MMALLPAGVASPTAPSFHVNFGDLPAWLAVVLAGAAAIAALAALRGQRREFARQAAVLERQQADQIDVIQTTDLGVDVLSDLGAGNYNGSARRLALVVVNGSKRPIRFVYCGVRDSDGDFGPSSVGPVTEAAGDSRYEYRMLHPAPLASVEVIRANTRYGFLFDLDINDAANALNWSWRCIFTDDAGRSWQIDEFLHLQPFVERSKYRLEPPRWLAGSSTNSPVSSGPLRDRRPHNNSASRP